MIVVECRAVGGKVNRRTGKLEDFRQHFKRQISRFFLSVIYSAQKNSFLFLKTGNQVLETADLSLKGGDFFNLTALFSYVI